MNYTLPKSLPQDIDKFATLASGFQSAKVSPTEFKAFRVPMGVYEQRKDGAYMARVRATGGFITPTQLLKLIDIARRGGSNLLHVTTRAEIQILNLELSRVEGVLRELQDAGLSTKGGGGNTVRNILVSEFSGISADEVFDTTPYAMALTNAVVPEADSYLMPRKMKIAFSSDPNYVDYAGINDIGLVAQVRDGRRGFRVYIGGGAGSKPSVGWLYRDFLDAEDLYALVKGMKDFFNAHGNRKDKYKARIRFIFYKLGKEKTFSLIDEYVAKAKETGVRLQVDAAAFGHSGPADRTTVLPLQWGNIWIDDDASVAKLRKVIEFAEAIGPNTLRFNTKQNIRFRNIPADKLSQFEALLSDYSAAYGKPDVLGNIVSCTGADTCRLGICLSKGLADAIYRALEESDVDLSVLSDARINISGCPNLCGQPLWSDLGFVGKVLHTDRAYPAYAIYAGANYRTEPRLAEYVGTVSARNIPSLVVDLAREFESVADVAKALNLSLSFGQWISTSGRKVLARLIDDYSFVPTFADDKNYYFDWGADDIFNVTKRGAPECSAGLFDMISVDRQAIADNRGRDAYQVLFHAARMLLVTRGLDPLTPADVFEAFATNFIASGYVSSDFQPIVDQAKVQGESGTYDLSRAEALADAVEALYQSMDDALQFHKPEATAAPAQPEKQEAPAPEAQTAPAATTPAPASPGIARSKDLRGVLCPMNFVRTKLELASLASGDVLEILLDDGKPIQNVPGSVRLEGHTVLSETQQPDGHWVVLIKKK